MMANRGFITLSEVLDGEPLQSDLCFGVTNKRPSIQIKILEKSANKKPNERKVEDFVITKTVNWNPVEECPLYRKYSPSCFLAVEFTNKCTASVIKTVLNKPISVEDCEKCVVSFLAFGYSATQLRDRKYVFYDKKLGKWNALVQQFGKFDAIKTVSKKAARIGLLFSSSTEVLKLKDEDIGSPVEDVTVGDYNFTDGCGFISQSIAQRVMKALGVGKRYVHQNPPVASVYQVRIKGSKGVLMLDPKLSSGIRLRKSMIKFEWNLPDPHVFGITNDPGLSRPYKVASLNLQFTRLLSALGIPDQVFLDKTRTYLQEVAKLDQCPGPLDVQIKFLCANQFFDEAEQLMRSQAEVGANVKEILSKIKKKILTAWEKKVPQGFTQSSELRNQLKLRIPIQDSRNVYGVCDPTEQLNYGECFFQPTVHGKPMVLDGVEVVVSKNPCYHPGDVRVLRCRNIDSLHHLQDCVVFPVKGGRPHSNEIAGSDLDGDEYFVCWDKELIPQKLAPPAIYKGSTEKTFRHVTEEQLKDSFAKYRNKMAVVNDLYELWANKKGAGCAECGLLADFFSTAVDSAKTGETVEIPEFLTAIKESPIPSKRFVWEKMLGIIDNFRTETITQTLTTTVKTATYTFDYEDMESLLNDQGISVTEFMRFRLLLAWLKQQKMMDEGIPDEAKVLNLLKIIDFSHFEPQQRMNALEDLHCYGKKAARLLFNSLYKSEILHESDIQHLQGSETSLSWVFEDRMTPQEFAWAKVNSLMTRKAVKMLVFQIINHGSRWVLALKVADALELHDSIHLFESSGKTSSSAYVSVHGPRNLDSKASPLQNKFMISLDGSRIQVYNSEAFRRTDTFICLMDLEDSQLGMSVALNKFDNSFSKNHDNARVYRHNVEKVELFCRHKKPHQTQRFSMFERSNIEDDESGETEQYQARGHEALEFGFREEDFPALCKGELTEYPHCKPLGFVTEFERIQNAVLEALHSGENVEAAFDELESCLKKPELCTEAALFLETLVAETAFAHKLRVSQCFNVIAILLSVSESGLPRIERFLESVSRLRIQFSIQDIVHFMTFIIYTLPAKEGVMATFLNSIFNSVTVQGLMNMDPCTSQYFLHWASLLSVEQYHHMTEAADRANEAVTFMKGRLFVSPEGERNVTILHMEGDHSIIQTDGFAVSLITDEEDTPYQPMFYFGIIKVLNNSIFHVKLMWPSDDAVLYTALNDKSDETKQWRVDVLPSLVTFNRMISALENIIKCYDKNNILAEIVGTLVQSSGKINVCLDGKEGPQMMKECEKDESESDKDESESVKDAKDDCQCVKDKREHVKYQKERTLVAKNDFEGGNRSTRNYHEDHSKVSDVGSESVLQSAKSAESSEQRPLNESQKQAVKASLEETLTLIQGPPGTGKTVTASRIIQQWLQHFPENKVLACAETNEGINNIIKALLKTGVGKDDILRVGSNIADDLREYSLEEQLRSHERRDKYRFNELRLKANIISKAKVICSTCIGSGSSELKDIDFRNVLIDEAGQALEPACLVSLRSGVKRLCLIGDEKQLPPLVISSLAEGLKESLFSRLSNGRHKVHLLNTQYRMHPQISHFSNKTFYEGRIKDASICEKPRSDIFRKVFPQNSGDKCVVFVNVQYCGKRHSSDEQCGESRVGPNLSNPKEVACVVKIVRNLLDSGTNVADIAVISPYRKQVECLDKKLNPLQVHVKTIDGFQGQEREIIIFSTVRSNVHPQSTSPGHLGHLKDPHRMNVALTRARSGLVVLGHRETLNSNPLWKQWLQFVDTLCFVTQENCLPVDQQYKQNKETFRHSARSKYQDQEESE